MATVTASEFIRNFGTYQRLVAREPVEVTAHGKVAGVYVSPEDAAILKSIRDSRRAYHVSEIPEDIWEAIAKAEPDEEMRALDRLLDDE